MRAKRQAVKLKTGKGRLKTELQDAQTKGTKRQLASVRQKEVKAKKSKRQADTEKEREDRTEKASSHLTACSGQGNLHMLDLSRVSLVESAISSTHNAPWHAGYVLYEL